MSSENTAIEFQDVWKKYSRENIFHRSLREDLINLFRRRQDTSKLLRNEFWALKRINLKINAGEAVGLFGPNGAGKSTILKLASSVTYPTQGTVKISGRIAPLLEIGAGFHPELTGRENIFVNGVILGMPISEIKQKTNSIIEFSEAKEFIDMPIKRYSAGMYLRLAFSVAAHSDSEIFLFDEVIAVGDSDFQLKCLDKINALRKQGKTIVLVMHDLGFLRNFADRILYLESGEIKS